MTENATQRELQTSDIQDLAPRLLQLVKNVAEELRRGAPLPQGLGLDHSLERDYGLDSLSRVELVTRIERDLGASLGEAALSEAETPRDLLRAMTAGPAADAAIALVPQPARERSEVGHPPDSAATFVEVLDWHAQRHGDRVSITLHSDGGAATDLTYAKLRGDARAVAAGLVEQGCGAGDAVAIMLPTGADFFAAFYGALYAGCVPVPIYPPARPSQLEDHLKRISGIVGNAEARVLVTLEQAKPLARLVRAHGGKLRTVATVPDLALPGGRNVRPVLDGGATALLQYTSGSTGDPKGVVLSHANLLANLRAMARVSRIGADDTFVSWLPLYHDMGLIGACMGSLYLGFRLVLMSPLAFLAKPSRWLRAIHRHRGTVSAAPNFAYELCLNKLADADLEGLDLGSWRLAFNGAEAVSPDTLERFVARFARYGLRPEAMMPVYGLAENSLGLTFPPLGRAPLVDQVDRAAFVRDGVAKPQREAAAGGLRFASCGVPLPGHEVRVVDAGGRELAERVQGRIQFHGPSATAGYLRNPAANSRLFDGEWLNTGDLGYFAAGELYVTGREKDIIIRGGFNIHPAELEAAVAGLPGVRKGGVAVFPAADPRSATERLVVLAEVRERDAGERRRISAEVSRLAIELIGMPPDDVVLVPPRTVLKTSSGKIRRAACRELYEQGALGRTQRAPWLQLVRLSAGAGVAATRRSISRLLGVAWACWAGTVFAVAGAGALLMLLVLPGLARRQRAARAFARLALRLSGIRVRVEGLDRLASPGPAVLVANHASYADSILLAAVLPPRFRFAAKRELAGAAFLGFALRRLGTVFVERFDPAGGLEDTRALEERVRAGDSLLVFPEGTFRRAPGLLPFKLGAFVAAAQAGVPVIPVALAGTRSLLRAGERLPRRADITIAIGAPIAPAGRGWEAVLALRDAARSAILAHAMEPDTQAGAPAGS